MDFKPLIGTEEATLDDKGRILVSKKKRERLGENFVLLWGDLGCLVAYPESVWLRVAGEVLDAPSINRGRDMLTRLMMGEAVDELNCDQQGRFVIPNKLKEKAQLKKDVLLIGLGDRVEIWAKELWEEFQKYPDVYGRERRAAFEKAYDLLSQGGGTWQPTSP